MWPSTEPIHTEPQLSSCVTRRAFQFLEIDRVHLSRFAGERLDGSVRDQEMVAQVRGRTTDTAIFNRTPHLIYQRLGYSRSGKIGSIRPVDGKTPPQSARSIFPPGPIPTGVRLTGTLASHTEHVTRSITVKSRPTVTPPQRSRSALCSRGNSRIRMVASLSRHSSQRFSDSIRLAT